METKPRILYLMKILQEETDEEHPLTTKQLIEKLQEDYGISAHRTTLAKDIAALQNGRQNASRQCGHQGPFRRKGEPELPAA